MKKFIILVGLVLLSGCFRPPVEETVEIQKSKKQVIGEMIISKIEQEMKRNTSELSEMEMVLTLIKKDLQEESQWIRSGREVDPLEVYKF